MCEELSNNSQLYLHESAGARILLPSALSVIQPFPLLHAKAKTGLASIIVTVTTCAVQRSIADELFQQPPRGTPSYTEVKIIRNGAISAPFPGKEIVWEVIVIGNPDPSHALHLLLELDPSAGVFAVIDAQGEGRFHTGEINWNAVVDSFYWDPAKGVFLKFDGDELAHRERYKKKVDRKKSLSLPQLPPELQYLQPVVDELLSLPPEEIHEDMDLPDVDRLLRIRTRGLSREGAIEQLNSDYNALNDWMRQDYENRVDVEFLLGLIECSIAFNFSNGPN